MSTHATAVEAIRRLATQYQDMLAAADLLEQVGVVEQSIAEGNARLAALLDEITKQSAARDAVVEEAARIRANADAALQGAVATAADTTAKAQAAAEALLAQARADAQGAIDAANVAANAVHDQQAQRESLMEAQLAALGAQIADADAKKAEAEKAAGEAKAKLDALNAQIASIIGATKAA